MDPALEFLSLPSARPGIRRIELEALKYLGEILNECFPAKDPVKVLYRLDIGHFHCDARTAELPKESNEALRHLPHVHFDRRTHSRQPLEPPSRRRQDLKAL